MRENDWTKLICEMLQNGVLGENIFIDTLRKIPYAYEIKSFTEDWNIDEYDQTLFETDMIIYEMRDDKIIPRVIVESKIESVTTHDAITYSNKANYHKNVVPFVRYGIMCGNRGHYPLPGRLFRHGTNFDFLFSFIGYEPSEKEKIAYIPDELFYFLQADTMEMMRYYEGLYPTFDREMFFILKEYFPTIDLKRNIRRLSKGMQKQVAFWLAICCKPEILILDEPVDGLDPVMRRQIWSILLAEVSERQMTVLVSSHNLRELEDVCDHVGIMNKGKVIIERSLSELQGNIAKIQVACQNGMPKLPQEFKVLHMSNTGRVYTLIVRGNPQEAADIIANDEHQFAIVDILPLTLEEIFIYEMGGVDYEVKDILF